MRKTTDPHLDPESRTEPVPVVVEPSTAAHSTIDAEIFREMMARISAVHREDGGESLLIRKPFGSEVEKDPAHSNRMRFTITTDSEDRMGDVIDVDGWNFDDYHGIVLFNHDYSEVAGSPPSQGKNVELKVQKHKVKATMEFHRKTQFNEELFQMYAGGYMTDVSVGFWPLAKPEQRETKDPEGGMWHSGKGLRFISQALLEWSLVAVGANQDAFHMAMKKGLVRQRTVEYLKALSGLAVDTPEEPVETSTQADGSGSERQLERANEMITLDRFARLQKRFERVLTK
jgi:phage head maturation protease